MDKCKYKPEGHEPRLYDTRFLAGLILIFFTDVINQTLFFKTKAINISCLPSP